MLSSWCQLLSLEQFQEGGQEQHGGHQDTAEAGDHHQAKARHSPMARGRHGTKADDRCQAVVEFMGNAAGHVPEGAQPFLLDPLLLRRLELLMGLAQL